MYTPKHIPVQGVKGMMARFLIVTNGETGPFCSQEEAWQKSSVVVQEENFLSYYLYALIKSAGLVCWIAQIVPWLKNKGWVLDNKNQPNNQNKAIRYLNNNKVI